MHERLPIGTHPLRERVEITDVLKGCGRLQRVHNWQMKVFPMGVRKRPV